MTSESKKEIGFWSHLVELVSRLRTILIAIIISSVAAMLAPVNFEFLNFSVTDPFYETITTVVIKDFQQRFLPTNASLLPMSPFAPLEVYMFVAFILGVLISSPVIAFELYRFLNPALFQHERNIVLRFVVSFAGLFIAGFVMGYFLIVPVTMQTLFAFSGLLNLPPVYDFTEFFSLIGLSLFLCGFIFTFPIYIVLLVKAGILQVRQLTKNRKYLYGGIIIIIAIVDPEPGLVTESLLFIPIVILMEVSIFLSKRIEKARAKAALSS